MDNAEKERFTENIKVIKAELFLPELDLYVVIHA